MGEPGRPSKYKPEYDALAYKYCLLGATNEQLAVFLEVGTTTLERWREEHESFRGAIKKGKTEADAEIAEALYHRAKGYSHADTHVSNYQGTVTLTPITRHYPPDTGAAFIWLKNRAGWTDKSTKEMVGPNGGPVQYENLSDEAVEARLAELERERDDD